MEIVPETERIYLASAIAKTLQCMGIVEGLKPKQMEAIESFVSGKDTFVALPTGYGKSLIFAGI